MTSKVVLEGCVSWPLGYYSNNNNTGVRSRNLLEDFNDNWLTNSYIFPIFSSCTSSFCVSSSRPTSSQASAKRSSIRNLFFNFWNFSTAKILVSVTSSRLSSTGYTENSSGYGHSLGSKSTTFSSSKLPIDQLSQFATVSCQPIYMEMSFEMSFKHKLVYYCML